MVSCLFASSLRYHGTNYRAGILWFLVSLRCPYSIMVQTDDLARIVFRVILAMLWFRLISCLFMSSLRSYGTD